MSEAAGAVASPQLPAVTALTATAAELCAAYQLPSSSSSSGKAVPASIEGHWGLVMQELLVVMQQRGSEAALAADVAAVHAGARTLLAPAVPHAPVTAGLSAAVGAEPAHDASSILWGAADDVQALPAVAAAAPAVTDRVPADSSNPSDADRQAPPPQWCLVMQELQGVLAGRAAAAARSAAVANSSAGAIISQEQQQQDPFTCVHSASTASECCASSPEASDRQTAAGLEPDPPHFAQELSNNGCGDSRGVCLATNFLGHSAVGSDDAGASRATVVPAGVVCPAQGSPGQVVMLQELKQRQAAIAAAAAAADATAAAGQMGFEQPGHEGSEASRQITSCSSACRSSREQSAFGLVSVADNTAQHAEESRLQFELQSAAVDAASCQGSSSSSDRDDDDAAAADAEQPVRGAARFEGHQLECQGVPPQAASASAVACHGSNSSSSSADEDAAAVQPAAMCGLECSVQVCQHNADSSQASSSRHIATQSPERGDSAAVGTCTEAFELSLQSVGFLGLEAASGAAVCSPASVSDDSSTNSSVGGSGSTRSSPRRLEPGCAAADKPSREDQTPEQHEQQHGRQSTAECFVNLAGRSGSTAADAAKSPCSRASSSVGAVPCSAQLTAEVLDASLAQQELEVCSPAGIVVAAACTSSSSSRQSSGVIDALIEDLLQAVMLQDTSHMHSPPRATVPTYAPTSRTNSTDKSGAHAPVSSFIHSVVGLSEGRA